VMHRVLSAYCTAFMRDEPRPYERTVFSLLIDKICERALYPLF
jgi:hypothetical protein